VRPSARRAVADRFQTAFAVSERRAVQAGGFNRSSHRRRSCRDPQASLRARLKELAETRVRYGYRRLHVLLQREGWQINHKRTYRLYSEERMRSFLDESFETMPARVSDAPQVYPLKVPRLDTPPCRNTSAAWP
jgi:transposase InsO family protein